MSRTGGRPVVLLTSVSLVSLGLAVLCTARLQHARATVRVNWAAAVSWAWQPRWCSWSRLAAALCGRPVAVAGPCVAIQPELSIGVMARFWIVA